MPSPYEERFRALEADAHTDSGWEELVKLARSTRVAEPGAPSQASSAALKRASSTLATQSGRKSARAEAWAASRHSTTPPGYSLSLQDIITGPPVMIRALSSMRMSVESFEAERTGKPRPQWGSKAEYLLSVIGFAVGLGNIWRFPKLAMENGGGAFLLPYFTCMFVLGLPLFILELGLGQMFQASTCKIWPMFSPHLRGVGWASAWVAYVGSFYYNIIITWSLLYLFVSFRSPLPWTTSNTAECMEGARADTAAQTFWNECITKYTRLTEPGWEQINWPLTGCLALAWTICFLCLRKGIESSGKVVLLTATFPYVVLSILFVRGVTLDGAASGILYYITPRFDQVFHGKVRPFGAVDPRQEGLGPSQLLMRPPGCWPALPIPRCGSARPTRSSTRLGPALAPTSATAATTQRTRPSFEMALSSASSTRGHPSLLALWSSASSGTSHTNRVSPSTSSR